MHVDVCSFTYLVEKVYSTVANYSEKSQSIREGSLRCINSALFAGYSVDAVRVWVGDGNARGWRDVWRRRPEWRWTR